LFHQLAIYGRIVGHQHLNALLSGSHRSSITWNYFSAF
jgi:hypothetical protein